MKTFACGDVVPGCGARFSGTSNEDILAQVGAHAARDHGLRDIPQGLVDAVLAGIH